MFSTIKKTCALFLIIALLLPDAALAISAADALVGIALNYYRKGYYDEALQEFNKVLLVEPDNDEAKSYIQEIKRRQGPAQIAAASYSSRKQIVNQALDEFAAKEKIGQTVVPRGQRGVDKNENPPSSPFVKGGKEGDLKGRFSDDQKGKEIDKEKEIEIKKDKTENIIEKETKSGGYIDIKGESQLAMGARSPGGELIWKEANGDLNERNFRVLFGDLRHNTFDPAIYDRLRLDVDTKNLGRIGLANFDAHLNLTVDPWSFIGKSEKFTVAGAGGDALELELKYWSNTGHTINETVNTLRNRDSIALPEIKVIDGKTVATTITSLNTNIFSIPEKKIERSFIPVREFWIDYKNEESSLRFFPMGYQDQAQTTDDPLILSNRHTWWEESHWLSEWKPGNLNSGAAGDWTKGQWDNSLSFFTRDSDLVRLTSLRGIAFGYDGVDTKIKSTIASPKNLWADYEDFSTLAAATRLTHDVLYNFGIGLTHTGHFGFNSGTLDGLNNVFSLDVKYEPFLGTKFSGQIAASESSFDRNTPEFSTMKQGQAYLVSMENRFPGDEIYDKDYYGIKKDAREESFLKQRIRFVHLDDGFDATLSMFRETRDDEFWSRHITFRKHPLYLYTGLTRPMGFEDILPYAIGDGLDSGRNVSSFRLEGFSKFLDNDLEGLLDLRHVRSTRGKFIENVTRAQLTYAMNKKLTTKLLGIRHDLPHTLGGIDPFIFDPDTDRRFLNAVIPDGEDPSLRTASLGFDYRLTGQLVFNTVWEYTNDNTLATDNFPRGLFNNSFLGTFTDDGRLFGDTFPFLYDQTAFGLPPYDFFNIYKFGFTVTPTAKLEFYLDAALNENKFSGQKDENMNHYGLEAAWRPQDKLSLFFKYVYSRWFDTVRFLAANGSEVENQWHNNFSFSARYQPDKDSDWTAEYGVGAITPLGLAVEDPFGGSLAVLDTQHILRLYYRRRF